MPDKVKELNRDIIHHVINRDINTLRNSLEHYLPDGMSKDQALEYLFQLEKEARLSLGL